ncbi:unnamed protein product [Bursaphelenchus xylophilus]|uniref:(pine wood nematode) hypothetical protein n=1 Tax=Bursaphelenchus xylophilus TaxID=6326 RepID=A0A1I7S532_BURXY|nr:unnamed protein product [Bursaphelenchus xylophilus]CAG9117648.1 unnamed protein product [Bursaphelenchus xylophilus]
MRRNEIVSASTSNLAPEIRDGFKRAQRRFTFNIAQIEKNYSNKPSSGIVFGCNDDSVEFDETLCTGDEDDVLINAVRREINHVDRDYGGSLLCTPAVDPEEADEKNLTRWKKLNKVYDDLYESMKSKENAVERFKQPALPSNRKRKAIEDSAPERKRRLLAISNNVRGSILEGPLESPENYAVVLDDRRASLLQPNLYQRPRQTSIRSGVVQDQLSLRSGALPSFNEDFIERRESVLELPVCSTPKAITYHTNSPMTRLRKRCMEVEKKYDLNKSIYAEVEGDEFVRKWIKEVKKKMKEGDLDKRIFNRWQRIETAESIKDVLKTSEKNRRKTR